MIDLKTTIEPKILFDRGKCRLLGAAGIVVSLALAGLPAQAAHVASQPAPKPGKEKIAALAAQRDPETTSSVRSDVEAGPSCAKSRKRLWVDGEGWIVRPVTTCY
ncbi:hypothetical protein [Microvirga sp. 2TAF3]|uniref:hypothetical protein n=1 Tax=Microvirga sp. 2TAF3 TaxID=3233014 RepID=UPI003F9A044D